jgi:hypothetical protein
MALWIRKSNIASLWKGQIVGCFLGFAAVSFLALSAVHFSQEKSLANQHSFSDRV